MNFSAVEDTMPPLPESALTTTVSGSYPAHNSPGGTIRPITADPLKENLS
jgi:hypothetical protein